MAIPVPDTDPPAILTAEGGDLAGREAGHGSGADRADGVAGLLGTVLRLQAAEALAAAERARSRRLMAFLRDLPTEVEPEGMADALVAMARDVAGGEGGLVATWDGAGEGGQVLARVGDTGGPEPGARFLEGDNDLTLAARAAATIRRDARADRALPLADPGERWSRPPRFTAVAPLIDASGRCAGLLAVWGDQGLHEDGLALLAALGPLLALQLQHARELVRFRERADRDALTGLPNRAALDERLRSEHQRFQRHRRPLTVLVLDLDHFKQINDSCGHPAGDAVLRRTADLLRTHTRDVDLAARFGGEEFVVVLPETVAHQAEEVAERIRAAIAASDFSAEAPGLPVTVSIGLASCPDHAADPAGLLDAADQALYRSKRAGRNRVTIAATMHSGG